MVHVIDLAEDFSRFPFGRFRVDGPFSAEAFREDILVPALKQHSSVKVILTHAYGLGSSFLDEAFSVLVARLHWTPAEFTSRIAIQSEAIPMLEDLVQEYVQEAYEKSLTQKTLTKK